MTEPVPPSALRRWITAARPWSWPASTMPVVFGTSLAVVIGGARPDVLRFALALLGMVVLHSAANMLSDVFDFKRGLDRDVTPVSGAIVRGWLSPGAVARGSILLFAVGGVIGLGLAAMTGTALLVVGAVGVAVGAGYTLLKYHALGDLAVFLNFGLLGALGAWIVQTRSFSWLPVVWTVPMAMLVIAILHANNWRDIVSDGDRASAPWPPSWATPARRPITPFSSSEAWPSSSVMSSFPGSSAGRCPRCPGPSASSCWPCPGPSSYGAGPGAGARPGSRWTSSSSTGPPPSTT